MKVLDMGVYDAILGFDWIQAHSPMVCNWANRTIEFQDMGRHIQLQDVQPTVVSLFELPTEQLVKWAKGNEI
jgi:hypothetical protein